MWASTPHRQNVCVCRTSAFALNVTLTFELWPCKPCQQCQLKVNSCANFVEIPSLSREISRHIKHVLMDNGQWVDRQWPDGRINDWKTLYLRTLVLTVETNISNALGALPRIRTRDAFHSHVIKCSQLHHYQVSLIKQVDKCNNVYNAER